MAIKVNANEVCNGFNPVPFFCNKRLGIVCGGVLRVVDLDTAGRTVVGLKMSLQRMDGSLVAVRLNVILRIENAGLGNVRIANGRRKL